MAYILYNFVYFVNLESFNSVCKTHKTIEREGHIKYLISP